MDTAIKDYEALKDALGAGWKRTDLVNQMAGKLADLWRKHLCR